MVDALQMKLFGITIIQDRLTVIFHLLSFSVTCLCVIATQQRLLISFPWKSTFPLNKESISSFTHTEEYRIAESVL